MSISRGSASWSALEAGFGRNCRNKIKIASANVAIAESQLQIVQLNKRFKSEVVDELKQVQTDLYDVTQQFNTVLDRVERYNPITR